MNDNYDRSYYEIALTNNQVITAFVILLACVLGAFVGGMWVARQPNHDRSAERGGALALQDGVEPIRFFGNEEAAADSASPSLPTPSGETLATARRTTAQRTADRSPPAGAKPATDPAVRLAAVEDHKEQPAPAAPAVVAPDAPSPDSSAARGAAASRLPTPVPSTASTVPPAAPGGFAIQVFSGTDRTQAQILVQRLEAAGFRAFLSPGESRGRELFRVRVGPYPDRAAAETDELLVKRKMRLDTWVTPN